MKFMLSVSACVRFCFHRLSEGVWRHESKRDANFGWCQHNNTPTGEG